MSAGETKLRSGQHLELKLWATLSRATVAPRQYPRRTSSACAEEDLDLHGVHPRWYVTPRMDG